MKITIVLPGRGFSGGVRCGVRMADELLHRGHDVRILYRRNNFSVKAIARFLYRRFINSEQKDWIARFNGECVSFKNLTAKLAGDGDAVISVGPDCVEEMTNLPDKCGVKVFYVHGLTLRNPLLRQIAWSKKVTKIAVSNYVRRELMNTGDDKVVAVVANGIDTSEYFPDGSDVERMGVGTVYDPGVAKDSDAIISIFARLYELRPEIPLVCFGAWPRPKELLSVVQYHCLPSVAQARRIYSRCSVWFCASRSEGFGMPLLEAMACGCAVVSRDCGGPRDFLRSGVNGIITSKDEPFEIATEILRIFDTPGLRNMLADEGMKTARTMSWKSAAEQMEEALKRIVK
jgi:glycosyltransferase involved in cell wall biosynthesis